MNSSIEVRAINIRRLEENFRRKYSTEQREMIDRTLREISDQSVVRLTDFFVSNKRQLPTPSEIRTQAARMGAFAPPAPAASTAAKDCELCMGTGYALHSESGSAGRRIWVDCLCPAGLFGAERMSTGKRIRVRSEADRYPLELFVPPKDRCVAEWVDRKLNWYLAEIESSRIYWRSIEG